MGGLDHTVLVQVKKKKKPANKGELLLFHSVLLDIPSQVLGERDGEMLVHKLAVDAALPADIVCEIV
jgi:hypothetical protein